MDGRQGEILNRLRQSVLPILRMREQAKRNKSLQAVQTVSHWPGINRTVTVGLEIMDSRMVQRDMKPTNVAGNILEAFRITDTGITKDRSAVILSRQSRMTVNQRKPTAAHAVENVISSKGSGDPTYGHARTVQVKITVSRLITEAPAMIS